DWKTGVQCTTLNIRDNMLDAGVVYIGTLCINVNITGNHVENADIFNFITIVGNQYRITVRQNYIKACLYGIQLTSGAVRHLTIDENYFTGTVEHAISIITNVLYPVVITNNYYFSGRDIEYPWGATDKEIGGNIYRSEEKYNDTPNQAITWIGGRMDARSNTAPAIGRWKAGAVCWKNNPDAGGIEGWIFRGYNAGGWGLSATSTDTDTVAAVVSGSVVTPTTMSKFAQGDILTITGAGGGAATLTTVIVSMDIAGGTFVVSPVVQTASPTATCTIQAGTWRPFGSVGGIATLADEATPTVLDGGKYITAGTANDPITDFDDGVEGQVITIIAEHQVVITDGTNIFLSGSANWTMEATETLTLICKADN
ncbi:unnamed protein product, partial [marine sediment metagenome]